MKKQIASLVTVSTILLNALSLLYAQDTPAGLVETLRKNQKRESTRQHLYSGSAHAEIDWEENFMVVTAYGAAEKSTVVNMADEKVKANEAAYLNAIEKLAEIVLGIRVTGQSTLEEYSKANSIIKQTIDGYIRGIDHLEEHDAYEELPDGSWLARTSIGIDLYGANGFIPKVLSIEPIWQGITSDPPPTYRAPQVVSIPQASNYSGLILDCRELGEQPSISVMPRIVTPDGKSVYGVENVPRSVLMNGGLMGYASSIDSPIIARKVGENSLIVKPIGVDSARKDHVVISQADANRIMWADRNKPFLDKARVLILF